MPNLGLDDLAYRIDLMSHTRTLPSRDPDAAAEVDDVVVDSAKGGTASGSNSAPCPVPDRWPVAEPKQRRSISGSERTPGVGEA